MSLNLEWTRPLGLVALVLPLLLLLLSRRRERPQPLAVGTFELWRAVGGTASGELRRRRVPLARFFLIAALTSGALALGGPRRVRVDPPRIWRVVLDESPSMSLVHTDGSGVPSGQGTRRERAVTLLDGFLAQRGASLSNVHWERPAVGREPPVWERHDRVGTLWLTDRVPDATPVRAGVIACGGGHVPGPVATTTTGILVWDGERLAEESGARPRRISLQGELAEPVASFASLWAAQRGLALGGDGEARDVALRVMGVEAASSALTRVARDGWSGAARVRRVPATWAGAALETWLQAPVSGAAWPVVRWRSGWVLVGLTQLDGLEGDPAAFAVSWSELFDAAVSPAPGVVSQAERSAAGPSLVRPPSAGPAPVAPAVHPWPLVSVLAASAAALALFALLLGGGRP